MRLRAPAKGCTVRMYRQGLGDCFLVAFGAGNGHQRYVLVDCGVLLGTEDPEATMKKVVRNVRKATGGRLHALVVTHEHWDHLSGFLQARAEFEALRVDALWLAWTEDPTNELAKRLRERRRRALQALRFAVQQREGSPSLYARRIADVMAFFGPLPEDRGLAASGRATTEEVFDWVKKRWSEPVYCKPGMAPLTIRGLPNVRFRVLGPPEDRKRLWKDRPSRGQVYLGDLSEDPLAPLVQELSARASGRGVEDRARRESHPFAAPYELRKGEVEGIDALYDAEDWRRIDQSWLEMSSELAIQLDSHTNNTSLVLAIELEPGGKVLLFAADAQVGNWLSWEDVAWPDEGEGGLRAEDLLARTVLYKVGHHGSHNATLREKGLEQMTAPELAAMIPVSQAMARKQRWQMPYEPLYQRLLERTEGRLILADHGIPSPGDANPDPGEEFRGRVTEAELYFDYTIEP